MTLSILLIFYVSKWKNNKKHWNIGIWRHCDVIIGRGQSKLGVGLLCTEMIIVCKFHDPGIIGSRDTEGGGGSEEPPPVTDCPKKPSLNRVKISWRVSTSLKARQFGHIQWDSLKNKNRWNIHIQNTPLNIQTRQRRGRRDWNVSREAGAPNHGYLLNQ